VCTSFFCKSSYGQKGLQFWNQFSDYLSLVEIGLMEEALVHLDFSPRQISDQLQYLNRQKASTSELKSWVLPPAVAKKIWQDRVGQQAEFFIKCFEFVQSQKAQDLSLLLGDLGQNLKSEVLRIAQDIKVQ
jgi:hypothetical protein